MGASPSSQPRPTIGLHREGRQDFAPENRTIPDAKLTGTLLKPRVGFVL